MRVLKICTNEWNNESRDKRELSVCRELGAEVLVMAKGAPGDDFRRDEIAGFPVYRFSTRPLGMASWLYTPNQLLSLLQWGRKARRFEADVITGHDLTGLLIAWISNLGQRRKALLVYDAHEFEMGRAGNRNAVATWTVEHLERFLIRRCAFSIMVNDTIADEVQRIHRLLKRPVVVRNIPNYWTLDEEKTAAARRELLVSLNAPEDAFLVMYHGAIVENRGVEQLLQATAELQNTYAIVLGNGAEKYLAGLQELCSKLTVEDRVSFRAAVPIRVLRHYVSAVNVGVVTVLPRYKSYYYMLPNKFFECIQSLTPVIVSDFPTIGALVDHYGIGLKVDPASPEEIAHAIECLHTDKALYAQCKQGLQRAKEELCWEKEKEALKAAYREILT